MESGGNTRSPSRGGDRGGTSGAGSGTNSSSSRGSGSGGSNSRSSGASSLGSSSRNSSVGSSSIIVSATGSGAQTTPNDWEMFQFGKYPMDILEMLSGHQAHQFKGIGLERQLQHQQQVQLQHQQQLQQQQQQPGETSGTLFSGIGLGSLQGSRSNTFAESSSIFAKMSSPAPVLQQQVQPSPSQSSRKSSKLSASAGSGSSVTGYPQFIRSFHPTEAVLAQDQLHPGMSRFEHFPAGSVGGGTGVIGGVVTSAPPPPPPLHPGLSVPQASPGPASSSPSPSSSTSTTNNPSSSSAVTSLGQPLVGGQSDARSLHQQFSCMLAANQYFLSGVPTNSLEQFLVQQGTHNHLGLGLGQSSTEANSGLAPSALHSSHAHSHATTQQPQQQQLPPHALTHPHSHPQSHHALHAASQPSALGSFEFQSIPVLSSNQLASLMQQEPGLPLPLPLQLSIPKEDGKSDSGAGSAGGSGGGGRRKKAMAGYLPQRKLEGNNSSNSNCHSSGDPNGSGSSGGHGHNTTSGLVGDGGGISISGLNEDHSSILASAQSSSTSAVSSTSSSNPSTTSASVLVTNGAQLSKSDGLGVVTQTVNQPDAESLYHCSECGKTFTHLTALRRHIRSHGDGSVGDGIGNPNHHHSESILPHSTQDAAQHQQSQSMSGGLQHSQQSSSNASSSSSCPSPDKCHCCIDCGKRFKKRGHLLQHGIIHSGARPYACSICQRSFNRRESLTRHEKIHEDKPYRCPACGRCFRESTSLLNHAASGSCGKPGRGSRSKGTNTGGSSSVTSGEDEPYVVKSCKIGALGASDMLPGGNGVGDYQGATLSSEGVDYGKTEHEEGEDRVVDCILGVDDDDDEEEKEALSCASLFQQGRGAETSSTNKTDPKFTADFSRNRYQPSYRGDNYRTEYKHHRSQTNPNCYSGETSGGNGMAGPALRKAPLAPTLHPHPHSQAQQHQQQQPHLPLSSLLDDSEDDVTSSVNNAMSAIAAAAASCLPDHNNGGGRGEERRDIIGGLLGGLGFGPLGASPGPSSTSGLDKSYRGGNANEDCMNNTLMTSSHNSQQEPNQQTPNVKPKRPRKPRAKKEPKSGTDASGEAPKRRRQSTAGGEGAERPYLCSVCGRGFSRRETLRRHDRIHTGEKPHNCSVCGKNFREAFHLTKHHTVHSGEKNYKCGLCGKDFGYAQSLKRHGKLHQNSAEVSGATGTSNSTPVTTQSGGIGNANSYFSYSQEKPQGSTAQQPPRQYTCSVCWKSFKHHFHLTAHQQAVHGNGERVFCCEVCGKGFAYSNSLTRHRLSQHGLTRTGQPVQSGGRNATASGGNVSNVAGSNTVPESEVATNTLLQLSAHSGGHVEPQTQTTIPHMQHTPSPSASGLSPLFYLPESSGSHLSSSLTHTQSSQNHSTISSLSNHQQSSSIKGEPLYPAAPTDLANSASSLFMPLPQLQHHQHHPLELQLSNMNRTEEPFAVSKSRSKRKNKLTSQGLKCGFSSLVSDIKLEKCKTGHASPHRKVNRHLFKGIKRRRNKEQLRKRKLLQLLWARVGGRNLGSKCLSSLELPQKRFPCPYCPCTTFPRQAALLVHRASRHPPRPICYQARLQCPVCGKHFHRFFAALRHRGYHLAQGSFACTRCPSRFWNGALLKRHKVACRGVGRGGNYGLKFLSAKTGIACGGHDKRTSLLTDSKL